MTEHTKKHVNSKKDTRRFQKKLLFTQNENKSLKQRIEILESSNKILETENMTYLKAIKNKLRSESTNTNKIIPSIKLDKDIDLQYKNDILLVVLQKCEEYNEQLKDQLCHVFLARKNEDVRSKDYMFEEVRDIFDKYKYHLEFNAILKNENNRLIDDNKFLKDCIINCNNLDVERECKRRKVVTLSGSKFEKCGIDSTAVHEEYSYKRKYELKLNEYQNIYYMHRKFLENLNALVQDINRIVYYIYSNVMSIGTKFSNGIDNVKKNENQFVMLQQNYENLLAQHNLKMNELDKLEHILQERNELIQEMQNEIITLNNKLDEVDEKHREDINALTKENMDLEEKLQVLTQIIESFEPNENTKND